MKKNLLSLLVAASITASASIEITSADMNWAIGNTWTMNVNSGASIDDFTSTGSSITWDLKQYAGSAIIDTIKVVEKSAGATATLKITSTEEIIAPINYGPQSSSSDWGMETFKVVGIETPFQIGASAFDRTATPHPLGFPHASSDTWQSTSGVIDANNMIGPTVPTLLNGAVIASGQVITHYGTFNALLVRETFKLDAYSVDQTYYYWETKEFGRIATLIEGKLSLMKNNSFNPVTVVSKDEVSVNALQVFPNPSNGNFTVKATALENVKIFDAIGNLVVNQNVQANTYLVNADNLNTGIYFVQATASGNSNTQRILIK
jgi:hypothetical protein